MVIEIVIRTNYCWHRNDPPNTGNENLLDGYRTMSTWINIFDRIIIGIGVTIQALHSARNDAIRLGKAPYGRIIPSGIIEHETEITHVRVLTGVGVVRRRGAAGIACLTPRLVSHLCYWCAGGIGGQ